MNYYGPIITGMRVMITRGYNAGRRGTVASGKGHTTRWGYCSVRVDGSSDTLFYKRSELLVLCLNCDLPRKDHAKKKCLYSPTVWKRYP